MYRSKGACFHLRHYFSTFVLSLPLCVLVLFEEMVLLNFVRTAFLTQRQVAGNYERLDFGFVMHRYLSAVFANFALSSDVEVNRFSEVAVLHLLLQTNANKKLKIIK
jgi:hypothetical protein